MRTAVRRRDPKQALRHRLRTRSRHATNTVPGFGGCISKAVRERSARSLGDARVELSRLTVFRGVLTIVPLATAVAMLLELSATAC